MPTERFTFPKTMRLRTQRQFDAVYEARVAVVVGAFRVLGKPNGLGHCRLGLNVSKRIGNAVKRNRVKRLLREAFRLMRLELPGGLDLLVIARSGEGLTLEACKEALLKAAVKLLARWDKMKEPT